jgi:hypothetical protein
MAMAYHPSDTRDALAEWYRDLIDAATAAGNAVFQTSTPSQVAKCELSQPCAGSASSGVITFNSITSDTNATGGVIARVMFQDGDATDVIAASIATDTSKEPQIGDLTIAPGSTVGISTLTLTAPLGST